MPPSQRLEWIDLFRGLAVLGMIWTHSAHTFIDAGVRQAPWFQDLDYYHGLIAPAFFWIAGFVRAHVTADRPKPGLPALKRLLGVMLIGYLLHVPWYSLLTFHFTTDLWRQALMADVLQCLAISGMLILLVEQLGRWRYAGALLLAALFVGLETPAQEWHTGLLPLDQYFNRKQGSLFSLFPWVAFGLAGFLTRFVWDGTLGRRGAGLLLVAAALAFMHPVTGWLGQAPSFFMERLGWVVMAAIIVSCAGRGLLAITGWLRLAGRESLLLYVVHLILIYAFPTPWGSLQQGIGPTQPPWVVAFIFVGVFSVSLLVGAWNQRRKRSRRASA